eukprot:399042-Karenia_brevis.AAC.1
MKEVGQYPPTCKPFNAPAEQIELDEPWSQCAENDFEFKVSIDKRFTRRQAMAKIHWESNKKLREIDGEALQQNLDMWTERKKKDAFMEIIDENRRQFEQRVNEEREKGLGVAD